MRRRKEERKREKPDTTGTTERDKYSD